MAKKIEVSKYEKNIMKARAISSLAETLQYRLNNIEDSIKAYQDRLNDLESTGADVNTYDETQPSWEYRSAYNDLLEELEKKNIIEELFKALDKMM